MKRIVTIDGPAGAGKSTVARRVAARLGWRMLDTGAMYRAVTLKALMRGIPLEEGNRVAEMIRGTELELRDDRVFLDGREVTGEIRANGISRSVAPVARSTQCRAELVRLQRAFGEKGEMVTEGRDQGSAVFPDAFCRVYLDASVEERARRRTLELRERGQEADEGTILGEIAARDESDRNRPVGPLCCPEGASVVDTDGKGVDEVVEEICRLVRAAEPSLP